MALNLVLLHDTLAVARLAPDAEVPEWATASREFSAVVRTRAELSLLTVERLLPADQRAERGYRAFAVRGPLPFDLVGVFASIVGPLADARISIFALSTFDTDYVLVKEGDLAAARTVLAAAGHVVELEPEPVRAGHLHPGPPSVGH